MEGVVQCVTESSTIPGRLGCLSCGADILLRQLPAQLRHLKVTNLGPLMAVLGLLQCGKVSPWCPPRWWRWWAAPPCSSAAATPACCRSTQRTPALPANHNILSRTTHCTALLTDKRLTRSSTAWATKVFSVPCSTSSAVETISVTQNPPANNTTVQ